MNKYISYCRTKIDVSGKRAGLRRSGFFLIDSLLIRTQIMEDTFLELDSPLEIFQIKVEFGGKFYLT